MIELTKDTYNILSFPNLVSDSLVAFLKSNSLCLVYIFRVIPHNADDFPESLHVFARNVGGNPFAESGGTNVTDKRQENPIVVQFKRQRAIYRCR